MTNKNNDITEYIITSLEKNHYKDKFTCGIDALDQYLKIQASQDTKKNVSVTYVLTSHDSDEIIGYYTLSSMSIHSGELPIEVTKKLPKYPALPGILLGRLAIHSNYHGKKIGSYLLVDALKRSFIVSQQIGIVAVIVDAKNESAETFYKNFGFISFPDNRRRLFLPPSSVKKLFKEN